LLKISTLKKYFIQYKPFLLFLGKFFLAYLILTFFYQFYLVRSLSKVDAITTIVAKNTISVLQLFDNASLEKSGVDKFIKIFYKETYVARVIEGCNAVSIIVLFVSFIIAFSGKIKQTILFIIIGSLIIYIFNVLRIALMSILMFHYPEQEHILHGVIFPLIIYGTVFILWIIWVNKFSKYATKTAS
jgi:exosortase family protein XrtF